MTPQETEVWNLVHNWCNGLQADIPDMAKRALMDTILERDKNIAEAAYLEGYSLYPAYDRSNFDEYWKSVTKEEQ